MRTCVWFFLFICLGPASAAPLSIVNVLRNYESLQGRRITIEGRAVSAGFMAKNVNQDSFSIMMSTSTCTLMYCGDTCCNTCESPVSLMDDQFGIALEGKYLGQEIGCSGNECGLTCNLLIGKSYWGMGILRLEDHGNALRLWLESPVIELIPPLPGPGITGTSLQKPAARTARPSCPSSSAMCHFGRPRFPV